MDTVKAVNCLINFILCTRELLAKYPAISFKFEMLPIRYVFGYPTRLLCNYIGVFRRIVISSDR